MNFPLAVVDYKTWAARAAMASFLVFALIAFPLGLRGEVLFVGRASGVADQRVRHGPDCNV